MSQKRSRVVRYAELRRKIENMTYYSFGDDTTPLTDYKSDEERHAPQNYNSPKVMHNTLSIPLNDLLEEDGKYKHRRALMSTQEFKAIDTAPEEKDKKKKGEMLSKAPKAFPNLFKKWWSYVIIGILLITIIVVVIVIAFQA